MQTNREEFEAGSSSIKDFWAFVNERHAAWIRRVAANKPSGLFEREDGTPTSMKRGNESRPIPAEPGVTTFSTDPIIAGNKFTNIFRELDRGTIALRRMEDWARGKDLDTDDLVVFNAAWYRMLNRREHATNLGWVSDVRVLIKYVLDPERSSPLFTGAHQTWLPKDCGPGMGVRRAYAENFRLLWRKRADLAKAIAIGKSTECAFEAVKGVVPGVGPFIAYEIVTDLQRTLLKNAPDLMTWCNINRGGGSARGLRRLGMEETVESCRKILGMAHQYAKPWLKQHLHASEGGSSVRPIFRIREVEHSLCEFDKYERVRTGLGSVRGGRFKPCDLGFDDGGFGCRLAVREVKP